MNPSDWGMVIGLALGTFAGNMLCVPLGLRTMKEGLCIGAMAGVLAGAMMAGYFLIKNNMGS